MRVKSKMPNKLSKSLLPLLGLLSVLVSNGHCGEPFRFKGAGWFGYGSIHNSDFTSGGQDLDGKGLITSGSQIAIDAPVKEFLTISAGMGVAGGHTLPGTSKIEGGFVPFGYAPYIAQANAVFHYESDSDHASIFKMGLFDYDYATQNQNLGLYLLRGPVYPGFVLSGFETKHVLPIANALGIQYSRKSGGITQDFLLTSETDFYPFYDLSPAYLIKYEHNSLFSVGAGVNFYHLIPIDPDLTTDPTNMVYIDTIGGKKDSIQLSAKGIKVMGNFSFSFASLAGNPEMLGPNDLILYGEVAVLGLGGGIRDDIHVGSAIKNKKANKAVYERLYGPISQRMPMMAGFNLPTFHFLDRLSIEVEYYTSPIEDELSLFNHAASSKPSSIPKNIDSTFSKDDFKWSIYAAKVIANHIKISAQLASDHYRPGIFTGYGDNNTPSSNAVLTKPTDWYWSAKVAYFF